VIPDSDILKSKTLSNGQIIALVFFAFSATFTVTKLVLDIESTKERIEYVNERIDKKFHQLKETE
jgi:predicted ABC-type ATPase